LALQSTSSPSNTSRPPAAAGVEESRDLDFKNDHYDKGNDGGDELAKDTDVSDGSELMIFVGPITARSRNSSLPIIGGQPAHLETTSSCKARCGAPSRCWRRPRPTG
jgi:hypothetical protein